jgi:hypothetical protein
LEAVPEEPALDDPFLEYLGLEARREPLEREATDEVQRQLLGSSFDITGHKTESVYRRYAIVSDADLQEAACRLAGTFPGTGTPTAVDSPRLTP